MSGLRFLTADAQLWEKMKLFPETERLTILAERLSPPDPTPPSDLSRDCLKAAAGMGSADAMLRPGGMVDDGNAMDWFTRAAERPCPASVAPGCRACISWNAMCTRRLSGTGARPGQAGLKGIGDLGKFMPMAALQATIMTKKPAIDTRPVPKQVAHRAWRRWACYITGGSFRML